MDIVRAYIARKKTSSDDVDAMAAKRKVDEDTIVVDEDGKKKSKRPRVGAKRERKMADPEVVEFIRRTQFPLNIVARHGALLGSQTK